MWNKKCGRGGKSPCGRSNVTPRKFTDLHRRVRRILRRIHVWNLRRRIHAELRGPLPLLPAVRAGKRGVSRTTRAVTLMAAWQLRWCRTTCLQLTKEEGPGSWLNDTRPSPYASPYEPGPCGAPYMRDISAESYPDKSAGQIGGEVLHQSGRAGVADGGAQALVRPRPRNSTAG